jgi:transcriptional regulator with XRE-family HTH domain
MGTVIDERDFSYVSDGAETLGKQPGLLKELAARLEMPESTLSKLRSGAKLMPSEAVGKKLEEILGIPYPSGWAKRVPDDDGETPVAEPEKMTPHTHLIVVRAWRQKLQRDCVSPKDITAALEIERKAVALVVDYDRDEKRFSDIIEMIHAALADFPDAREAVKTVLEEAGY